MSLIISISGVRGTIGGKPSENLTPEDLLKFTSAYATWLKNIHQNIIKPKVVIGRDARISGKMVSNVVVGTLLGCGIDVIDIDLATTPTVEMVVTKLKAQGGVILTASHNPKQWNALKLLNHHGEFLSQADGEALLNIIKNNTVTYADVDTLGEITSLMDMTQYHVDAVLKMKDVTVEAIQKAKLKVVVDVVNSVGALAIPPLLDKLGVKYILLNGKPNGIFAHNPEPLPEHLTEIAERVCLEKADLGIVVDPDVDRVAFISENGEMFGEEYSLVAIAKYILSKQPGNTVSNLSSSRALRDVTEQAGGKYYAAAVGEVNVVAKMKAVNAVFGGEGNGGIISPELHYGRDALVGIALFLSYYVQEKKKMSELRMTLPSYYMVKTKVTLPNNVHPDQVIEKIKNIYSQEQLNTEDGVKIDFEKSKSWVHLRKSNTEPIIRIYAEAQNVDDAERLVLKIKQDINIS